MFELTLVFVCALYVYCGPFQVLLVLTDEIPDDSTPGMPKCVRRKQFIDCVDFLVRKKLS